MIWRSLKVFGVGISEVIVIAALALLVLGPKRLPEVAKQAGRLFVQFKRMTSDVRSTVDDFIRQAEEDLRKEERETLLKVLGAKSGTDPMHKLASLASLEQETSHGHPNAVSADPHKEHRAAVIDTQATTTTTLSPETTPSSNDPHADIK